VRTTRLVDLVLASKTPEIPMPEEALLADLGDRAVPALLDALYRTSLSPGFSQPAGRRRVQVATRVLQAIRRRVDPGSPLERAATDDATQAAERRAKAWFLWWSRRSASAVGGATGPTSGPK
jgi:hypothetical protein